MIALTSSEGRWLKTLASENDAYIFHSEFGFLPESQLTDRISRRERCGLYTDADAIRFRFRVARTASGSLEAGELAGCEAAPEGRGIALKTAFGNFHLLPLESTAITPPTHADADTDSRLGKYLLAALLFAATALIVTPRETQVAAPEIIEPVKVTIIPEVQKQKSVRVPEYTSEIATRLKVQDKETRRAIQQNLGFLGLLGKKNLSKALGGMPSTIKDASPGAGAGGKEGSGGEYLVGLGQGVRRATVGNTGVAGLGGIGTKGAGGGAGGYGDSMVGSGEGKALSKLALSNELTLEGGLDRGVIQATIAKYLSQVRACYEAQLQNDPGLAGQVTMGFSINGEGSVTSAQVSRSTLGNAPTENCISARMKTWKFPKPVGGVNVKVNYPFLLRPAGA